MHKRLETLYKSKTTSPAFDNGTNFGGAERELREAPVNFNEEATGYQSEINWTFNLLAGSNFGGVWKRMICMMKKVLCSVLLQQNLDDDGIATVFCEAKGFFNDRPITKLMDDPNNLEPIMHQSSLVSKRKAFNST